MTTIRNLHDISAFFFFLLGFIYVALALTFRNDFLASEVLFAMRLLDIPFAFTALAYGGSSLYLQLQNDRGETESAWGVVILALCLLFFGAVIFMNFAFPDLS